MEAVQYEMTLNDLLTPKMREADGVAKKFEGTLESIRGTAGIVGSAIAAAFAVDQLFNFGRSVVDAGSKVEDARTGLTTLLRDANEASRVIQNTMMDATKTPFGFEGLLSANKALISAGEDADGARGAVLNLANAIAATGGGDDELQRMVVNLQQIRNTGVATAMDIKQFAFAGINIYQVLAEATGKPLSKVKEMEVSYSLLTSALQKAHDQGGIYANGLENMAGNTSVQLSNMSDAIFQFSVRIFDDFKPAIEEGIASVMSFIGGLSNAYEWAKNHKDLLSGIAQAAGVLTAAYIGYKSVLWATVIAEGVSNTYKAASVVVTELLIGYELARSQGLGILTAAQWALNVALTANPIGVVVAAVAAFGAIIYVAYKNSETFRAGLMGVLEVAKQLGKMFYGVGETIVGALTFDFDLIKKGLKDQISAANDIGGAFAKGYNESIKESAEAKGSTIGKTKPSTIKKNNEGIKTTTEAKSKVTGTKSVNINIQIGSLVKELKISTTNLKESTQRIQDEVTKVLLSAVNDSQIVAGT